MPAEFFCTKMKVGTIYSLVPCHESDETELKKLENRPHVHRIKVTRIRNVDHHRKYFALLNYAFDVWEPPPEQGIELRYGQMPEKDFDEFRKNIAILAGWRKVVFDVHGGYHYRARSISFANMDQAEFEQLYDKTIDVIIKHVLRNYTGDELRAVVEQIQEFDS